MTKHRYTFGCGGRALATNEEALRVSRHGGETYNLCPKCHDFITKQYKRCLTKHKQNKPLPAAEG